MTRKRPHKGKTRRSQGRRASKRRELLMGNLRISRPGAAVVETPEGSFRVAAHGVREGMNGDEVQVSIVDAHGGEKLAYVQSVIGRATSTFLGRFEEAGPLGAVVPLDARLGRDFFVLPEDSSPRDKGVSPGDIVSARILEYPTRSSAAVVTIERRVGAADELDVDIEAIIASYGLATVFPENVLAEAAALALDAEAALAADPARADLRGELCITIDPADARDFDDAVGAARLEDGGYELAVHIADVSHYVGWNSSIDNEAKQRACSVYLVDRVLPMLPERLCNDICSLRPGEDRLAMSVRVRLDRRGEVLSAEACPSVIRSSARLSYDEADASLVGEGAGLAPEVAELIATLDEIRELREDVRIRRGAIDFDTVEARVVLDSEGHPTGVSVRKRTRATGLIEEAMLVANECVAKMLADAEMACAYRVHERPAPDHLKACVLPLRELDVLDAADAKKLVAGEPAAIRRVLDAARGTNAEYLASALLLRAQKRAVYLPANEGHYALGAPAYCHFTSPIRRYPDITVHRALKALLSSSVVRVDFGQNFGKNCPESTRTMTEAAKKLEKGALAALPQICATASERERAADAAARASQKVKMAELYAGRIGEKCSGIVSGCERYGLFVQLDDTFAEGLLPTRELGSEWFAYDEERMTLTGEETGRSWGLGKRVAVVVAGADPARGQIDFALVSGRNG